MDSSDRTAALLLNALDWNTQAYLRNEKWKIETHTKEVDGRVLFRGVCASSLIRIIKSNATENDWTMLEREVRKLNPTVGLEHYVAEHCPPHGFMLKPNLQDLERFIENHSDSDVNPYVIVVLALLRYSVPVFMTSYGPITPMAYDFDDRDHNDHFDRGFIGCFWPTLGNCATRGVVPSAIMGSRKSLVTDGIIDVPLLAQFIDLVVYKSHRGPGATMVQLHFPDWEGLSD